MPSARSPARIRGVFRRLGLLPRVGLALVAVGTIPLAIAVVQLVRINANGMAIQVLRTHSVAARATSDRVSALIEGIRAPATAVAANPGLNADPSSAASQQLLIGLLHARSDLAGIVITDPGGDEVLRVQRRELADAVSASLANPPSILPRVNDDSHGPRIGIDVPLSEELGWLRLIADATPLVKLLDPEELGDEAEMVIVGRDGALVLSTGHTATLGFPASMLEAATSGRVGGSGRFTSGDDEQLGAFSPVPGTSWTVLSKQPAAVAEQAARRMWRRAAGAVLVATLLAATMVVAAYRSLVQPLREVVAAQRRLAGLSRRPAPGTEIDVLRESFAALERRIRDQDDMGKVFLGRYQVVELIGEGAMGSVFRGWDPRLERPVALKTIRIGGAPGSFQDTEQGERLLREAVLVARFSHPNIVAVYDVEDTPEAAFIAMEYVDGATLSAHLAVRKRLPPCEAAVLAAAVAAALGEAHDKGMVHHDIKPGNILLGFDGSIKVTDFGISQYVSSLAENQGLVMGTPGYLPPEALQGQGFEERSDLFALGVVLYECIAGRQPFSGRTIQDCIRATLAGTAPELAAMTPEAPGELVALTTHLIRKEVHQRPASAAETAKLLQRFIDRHDCRWNPPRPREGADHGVTDDQVGLQLVPTTRLRRNKLRR